jgi:hypothetical protein
MVSSVAIVTRSLHRHRSAAGAYSFTGGRLGTGAPEKLKR